MNTYKGLTPEEVLASRSRYGANRITPPEKESIWSIFLDKFKDPLIIVLLVVLVLSTGISLYEYFSLPNVGGEVFLEPLGVLVALLLATGVGVIFEARASKAFDVLNQVGDETPVTVIRQQDGVSGVRQIQRSEVVVGDIVLVSTGEEISADGNLLESVSLSVNESTLTGEPLASKYVPAEGEAATSSSTAAYPVDRLMKGTTVMEGNGVMQVTAVGDASEYGRVCQATQIDSGVHTPLNRQLNYLGRFLSKISFVVAAGIIVGRFVYFFFFDGDKTNNDEPLEVIQYALESIMVAVTLIVVAVPEGLPLSITLSLALSMKKMLHENNLVRKLHACETMGAATVICTDKTGTLTQNCMQVSDFFLCESSEQSRRLLAESIAVNSTAWLEHSLGRTSVLGNPTEGALLLWLASDEVKADYEALRKQARVIRQEPFTTETKRMTTTVMSPLLGCEVTYVKGAPELLLSRCTSIAGGVSSEEVLDRLEAYQRQSMRTLGFAYSLASAPDQLIFIGVAAISDPIRRDVPESIAMCREAGIRVIIVTGDTIGTAREIGRQVGVEGESLTGAEFAAMSDEQLRTEVLPKLAILCRARPMDKQRLVKLLQRMREVVAVTGDGTNDAPALNAAHVGLSMGDGTAVAKEASDITIIDNSFSSIVKAVMWGRSLYNNIGRFLLFQMTVNVSACVIVLLGAFLGKESPLSVTQMLWVNLIMDTFAAMALSALPPEKSVMHDKPRSSKAHIINRQMVLHVFGWGIPMSLLLVVFWMLPELTLRFPVLEGCPVAHRHFFTIFVMLQFWNLFNARYFRTGRGLLADLFFRGSQGREEMKSNFSIGFVGIALLIIVGQVAIVHLGGKMFNIVEPLTVFEWVAIIGATSLVFLIGELIRLLTLKRR